MTEEPAFDTEAAHRFFAASCFNSAWELIDKPDRTAEDNERMIHLAHASIWHWTQRPDCSPANLSIGYWQASRVYALAADAENARKYAQLCLDVTPPDKSFFVGYAYEALARAEWTAQNHAKFKEYLSQAWRITEQIAEQEDVLQLINDLKSLEA